MRKTSTTILTASRQKHGSWQLYCNEKNGLQQFQMEGCQPIKRLKEKKTKKKKKKKKKRKKKKRKMMKMIMMMVKKKKKKKKKRKKIKLKMMMIMVVVVVVVVVVVKKKKSNSVNEIKILYSLRLIHISILQGHHQAALEYLKK